MSLEEILAHARQAAAERSPLARVAEQITRPRQIAFISDRRETGRRALKVLEQELGTAVCQSYWANGVERIVLHDGTTIHLFARRNLRAVRGRWLTFAVLDFEPTIEERAALDPCFATTAGRYITI